MPHPSRLLSLLPGVRVSRSGGACLTAPAPAGPAPGTLVRGPLPRSKNRLEWLQVSLFLEEQRQQGRRS